jgi:hypothetical protein
MGQGCGAAGSRQKPAACSSWAERCSAASKPGIEQGRAALHDVILAEAKSGDNSGAARVDEGRHVPIIRPRSCPGWARGRSHRRAGRLLWPRNGLLGAELQYAACLSARGRLSVAAALRSISYALVTTRCLPHPLRRWKRSAAKLVHRWCPRPRWYGLKEPSTATRWILPTRRPRIRGFNGKAPPFRRPRLQLPLLAEPCRQPPHMAVAWRYLLLLHPSMKSRPGTNGVHVSSPTSQPVPALSLWMAPAQREAFPTNTQLFPTCTGSLTTMGSNCRRRIFVMQDGLV